MQTWLCEHPVLRAGIGLIHILLIYTYSANCVSELMLLWLQLNYGKDDLKEKIEIVAILSMSDQEIYDALDIVSRDFVKLSLQFLQCQNIWSVTVGSIYVETTRNKTLFRRTSPRV